MNELVINSDVSLKPEFYNTDYSDALSSNEIKPHLETIYERWNGFGFTDGLKPELKKKCAYVFEQLAQYLIHEKGSDDEKKFYEETCFETIGFPIIRRVLVILDEDGIDFKFKKFIEYYNFFNVNEIMYLLKGTGFNIIDEEAEAVAMISMMIERMFINPDKGQNDVRDEVLAEFHRIIKEKENN